MLYQTDFFNQNINSYMDPEKRDISYILIDKNDYQDQLKPSNAEIEQYYNNNKNLFLEPEKRDFLQFNFKSLEEASEFKNKTMKKNQNLCQKIYILMLRIQMKLELYLNQMATLKTTNTKV